MRCIFVTELLNIYKPDVANIYSIINQNTIKITSQNASGDVYGILSKGINTLSVDASLTIDSNKIIDCSITTTNSSFNGIVNNSSFRYLTITQNIIAGLITNTTTGGYVGIANYATLVEQITISLNKIGTETKGAATFTQATTGTIDAIKNANILRFGLLQVQSNTIEGFSVIKTGVQKFINSFVNQKSSLNVNYNHLGSPSQPLITITGVQVDSVYGIICNSDTAYMAVGISQNTFYGFVNTNTAQCNFEFITHKGNTLDLFITSNNFNNLLINTTKNVTFINNEGLVFDSSSTFINANETVNTFNKTGGTGDVVFISNQSSAAISDVDVSFLVNKFNNVSVDGNSNVYFIKKADTANTLSKINYNSRYNSFANINVNTGTIYGYTIAGCKFISYYYDSVININTNGNFYGFYGGVQNISYMVRYDYCTISNISSTVNNGVLNGFFSNAEHAEIKLVYSCDIDNIFSSGINTNVNGIAIDSGDYVLIIKNKINNVIASGGGNALINGMTFDNISQLQVDNNELHTFSQTGVINGANTGVNGVLTKGNEGFYCYNNTVANLLATQANLTNAINGIKIMDTLSNSTNYLYHNTISLNASSTGANFGTSGLYHVSSNTMSTSNLYLNNNLISNTSTSNGSGATVAFRRFGVDLDNYDTSSNYNLFYAGIPSPSNLIYNDGVNSDQTIANFKLRVSTRETKSISVLPIFVSATDLHLTDANCGIDGKGGGSFLGQDLDGQVRDTEAPDIGADEFTSNVSTTLAGVVGATVCDDRILSSTLSTIFKTENCNPIAIVDATGALPVAGQTNVCVYIDPAVVPIYNAEPYVQRHIDILPTTSTSSTTGTITLYFTNEEFENFNANNGLWPNLPTLAGGGNADPNKSNLRITQYHGVPLTSPSSPNQYSIGTAVLINPDDNDIIWNGNYWEVKFNVTGFSGFYVHTNLRFVLPVTINNLTGAKQNDKINLNWKITCNNTGKTTLILEKSADGVNNFIPIKNISITQLECSKLFSHTDFNAFIGNNFYRVKIIDEYGNIGYSNTVLVINANKGFEITNVFPNPVNGNTLAKVGVSNTQAGVLYFVVIDMQGRVIKSFNKICTSGYNLVDINLSDIKPGNYIIKINGVNGECRQIKVLKK
ncbi:MAG: T9SS type A sorting domain-containing protein [Ferruginibacter sp.]|nr:T9SS type A sorting domain-containing protein [Ferruginibacter sp.]